MGLGAFADFTGTYEVAGSEGYEEYLESIGLATDARKDLASPEQILTITQEGDHYTFKTTGPARTIVSQFTLGQEFVESPYGEPVKGIARRDGIRIILQQKNATAGFESTTVFSIDEEGIDMHLYGPNNTVAKRRYKRRT
ncbi:lipocalin/fatty-acid binding family protein [Streptomyces sp. NPDC056367]|uniref:lipocalin/fatty-acid binding family protein n=1 Tax=Streptomyces sp. NPDC056367 TaxID=3345797 RepID=UPI0035D87D38